MGGGDFFFVEPTWIRRWSCWETSWLKKGNHEWNGCSWFKVSDVSFSYVRFFTTFLLGMLTSSFIIFPSLGMFPRSCHHATLAIQVDSSRMWPWRCVATSWTLILTLGIFWRESGFMVTGMMWTRSSADWNLLHKCYSISKPTACP